MSDEKKSQGTGTGKGKDHPIAYEVIFIIMLVMVVGLISFSAGRETSGRAIFFVNQNESGAQDPQIAGGAAAADDSPVIALVNDVKITRNQVLELVNSMPQQMQQIPTEKLVTLAVEQLVNNAIVDEKAAQANLAGDPDVQKQLAQVRKQIFRTKFIENEIAESMSEARLKEAYQEYVKNFPEIEEVKAAHILVNEEDKAKDIIAKLDKGADFAELAKENSQDGTAESGGDLGYFAKTDVVPEFAEAAFNTKVGGYTKAPVKSNFGYHVIKVEDKRKRPAADFATARPYLEQELRRTVLDEIVMKWRNEAEIERFDMNGKPVSTAPESQEPAAGASDAPQGGNEESAE